MPNLKRDVNPTAEGGRLWCVYGTNGAMSWEVLATGVFGPIGIHSPRPLYGADEEPTRCDLLEGGCYADAGYVAGDELGKAWEAAGCDDELIWRELEGWYTSHLSHGRAVDA